jgi:hypothetical protein
LNQAIQPGKKLFFFDHHRPQGDLGHNMTFMNSSIRGTFQV